MNYIHIHDFKAGTWVKQLEYQSFRPELICKPWISVDPEINELLGIADRKLGALDAFASLVPDVDFFIKMHIAKEATTSSKIEGTQTSFEEALIDQTDIDPEKRDDWKEVSNYIQAIHEAQEALDDLPISSRLIRNTHKTLLEDPRGKDKLPGSFRISQNWIGSSLKNAKFVPPHHTEIADLMTDLEQFIHAEDRSESIVVPHLIKIAMVHYQFETIHPFLDGNGRIGRLLITLYLMDKGLLDRPTLYLSDYFERNRADYYDHLTSVRSKNALNHWIRFFINGVIETADRSITTFKEIIKLREHIAVDVLPQLGRTQKSAQQLITYLYTRPILDGKAIAKALDVHASNANKMIEKLIDQGILKEMTGYSRNRMFSFAPYVGIFAG